MTKLLIASLSLYELFLAIQPDAKSRRQAAIFMNQQLESPFDDPAHQKLVQEMATQCKCTPHSSRPCDGLLAGGMCDDLHLDEGPAWLEDREFNGDETNDWYD